MRNIEREYMTCESSDSLLTRSSSPRGDLHFATQVFGRHNYDGREAHKSSAGPSNVRVEGRYLAKVAVLQRLRSPNY